MREDCVAIHFFHPRRDVIAWCTVMCIEQCPRAVLAVLAWAGHLQDRDVTMHMTMN